MTRSHFKEAMSYLASGVSILTCRDEQDNYGITISSLSSVGVNPPAVLVCVEGKSAIIPAIRKSRSFGVTILRDDQLELGIRFANPNFSNPERFDGARFEIINNCPLISGGLARISCDLEQEVALSENIVFFGHVNHVETQVGKPLIYFHRTWRELLER